MRVSPIFSLKYPLNFNNYEFIIGASLPHGISLSCNGCYSGLVPGTNPDTRLNECHSGRFVGIRASNDPDIHRGLTGSN
ncbi:MAG: hypothetical protein QME51_01495, partial [Planctomycetota bacterium]|nr:hypothetical protein [Planctomycetota bacterium]